MSSDDLRARMAEWEARMEKEAAGWRRDDAPSGRSTAGETEDSWPWQFLFDDPFGDPDRLTADFDLSEWLAMGLRGLRSSVRGAGMDDEFWGHMRAAEREFLLAWRSLIDARLQRLDDRSTGSAASSRLHDIPIDFE
jgi:hypothetical protein